MESMNILQKNDTQEKKILDVTCGACVGECDEYIKERAKDIIRKHMNDGWIPVEERMPEDGTYLCTLDGELCGIEEPFTGMCGIENGIWDEPDCVIAWRHLPEPYRPERSEGE